MGQNTRKPDASERQALENLQSMVMMRVLFADQAIEHGTVEDIRKAISHQSFYVAMLEIQMMRIENNLPIYNVKELIAAYQKSGDNIQRLKEEAGNANTTPFEHIKR